MREKKKKIYFIKFFPIASQIFIRFSFVFYTFGINKFFDGNFLYFFLQFPCRLCSTPTVAVFISLFWFFLYFSLLYTVCMYSLLQSKPKRLWGVLVRNEKKNNPDTIHSQSHPQQTTPPEEQESDRMARGPANEDSFSKTDFLVCWVGH